MNVYITFYIWKRKCANSCLHIVRNSTKVEYGYANVVVAVSIQQSWCIHWPNGEYERLLEFIKRFSSLLTAIAFLIMLFEYSVIPSGIKPFIDIKRENNFVETMSQRIYLICTASEMILWRQENSLGYTIDTHHM